MTYIRGTKGGTAMDVQSAMEVATRLRGVIRSADVWGFSREEMLIAIASLALQYDELALDIELQLEREAA